MAKKHRATAAPSGTRETSATLDFAPASVVINAESEIQHFHGSLRNYLQFPEGAPTSNLLAIASPALKLRLQGLIQATKQDQKRAKATVTSVRGNAQVKIELSVEPVPVAHDEMPAWLVTFRDVPLSADEADSVSVNGEDPTGIRQLEHQLQATREDLQGTIEELETSNEELNASNEEVTTINEELQSTNKELEISREELQSLNEELANVNSQLKEKVDELQRANDDLGNLLTSTEIATVFLDTQVRIRRFTPAAAEILNVIPGDIGRPISDLAKRVHDVDLLADAATVLRSLCLSEKEVGSDTGDVYMRRIRPYRTSQNKVDGIVVTYTDVTGIVRARAGLERRERQQATVAALGRQALGGADLQDLFEEAVRNVSATLEVPLVKVLQYRQDERDLLLRSGVGWRAGLVGTASVSGGRESQGGFTFASRTPIIVKDLEKETRFQGPALLLDHGVVSGISVIIGAADNPWGVLGAHATEKRQFSEEDVNFVQAVSNILGEAIQRKDGEDALRLSERRLLLSQSAGGVGTWDWDLAGGSITWSGEMFAICGIDPSHGADANRWFELVHPQDRDAVEQAVQQAVAGAEPYDQEFRFIRPDGQERWLAGKGEVIFEDRKAVRFVGTNIDITARKLREDALLKAENFQRLALIASEVGTWEWDLQSDRVLWGPHTHKLFGLSSSDLTLDGKQILEFVHKEDRQRVDDTFFGAFDSDTTRHSEFRVILPDGSTRWLMARAAVSQRDRDGQALQVSGVNLDITDRKKAQQKLMRSERSARRALNELESIYQNLPVGLCALDSSLRIVKLNELMARMSGSTGDELVGKPGGCLLPDLGPAVEAIIDKVSKSGVAEIDRELTAPAADGRKGQRHWLTSWAPSKDGSGQLEFLTCVAQDITTRKKAEETLARQQTILERQVKQRTKELLDSNRALEASRQELRALAARLTDAQEQGYRSLARELHDVFGQHLALLAMQIGALSTLACDPSEEFLQRASDARQEIERLSREIHALSRQLHPSILDDLGLPAAVAELCHSYSDSLKLETAFTDVGCEELVIPAEVELSLYRVAQECLTNVAKHSGDPRVDVSLVCQSDKITLTVRDYGRGFEGTAEKLEKSRLGLVGMKERMAQIGGTLSIDAQPGQGAAIVAEVSLDGRQ